jgi:hypothetical protein
VAVEGVRDPVNSKVEPVIRLPSAVLGRLLQDVQMALL